MRRRLITIAIFLLAGAVVNVGVAWGCAILIRLSRSGPAPKRYLEATLLELEPDGGWRFWAIERIEQPAVVRYYSYWDTRSGLVECHEVEPSTELGPSELAPSWGGLGEPPATDYEIRWAHAYGWPFLSAWRDYVPFGDGYRMKLAHGLELTFLAPDGGFPRAIPLRPVWPGFAVNTLFYAALLWLLIPGPFVLWRFIRRLIRQRRGLCPGCGYDLRHGEHEACPECGVSA